MTGFIVGLVVGFIIGFAIASIISYYQHQRFIDVLETIETKYQTIVNVISAWQKKL